MVRYAALIASLTILLHAAANANPHAAAHRTAPPPVPTPVARPVAVPRPAAPVQFRGRRFIGALGSVNLNGEQRDRIKSLVESTRAANAGADPETRRQNVAKMRAGIWETLTPEQQAQFRNELNKPQAADGSEPPP